MRKRSLGGLWASGIRLYARIMARKLYNHPLLANARVRDAAFASFVEAYATSLDIDPICYRQRARRPIDQLWEDFVAAASDVNRSVSAHIAKAPGNGR